MDKASAVEPHWCANSRKKAPSSACEAPPPPSSCGTPAAKMLCCLRMSKFSATKESSASWAAARGANSVPSCWARATQSVLVSIAVVMIWPFCIKGILAVWRVSEGTPAMPNVR